MNTWAFFERLIIAWLAVVTIVEIGMAIHLKRAHMSMYWAALLASAPFLVCYLYILPTMIPVVAVAFWLLYRYSKWLSNIGVRTSSELSEGGADGDRGQPR